MTTYKSSKKASNKLSKDLAFVNPALGALAGVAIGWIIANFTGII